MTPSLCKIERKEKCSSQNPSCRRQQCRFAFELGGRVSIQSRTAKSQEGLLRAAAVLALKEQRDSARADVRAGDGFIAHDDDFLGRRKLA